MCRAGPPRRGDRTLNQKRRAAARSGAPALGRDVAVGTMVRASTLVLVSLSVSRVWGRWLFPVRYIIGNDSRRLRYGPDRRERKRADLSERSRRDRPAGPADREPLAEPEPTPERRDATGMTACPDCAGQHAAQLSILPATEPLVRCLDCGAEYVARSKPA